MLTRIWNFLFQHQSTPAKSESDGTQWCLIGNIIEESPCGEGGSETRQGTKHFSPGTKVYCMPAQWGDGYDRITVIGRHRKSKRFVIMVISSTWVTNWRAKVVYHPAAIEQLATLEKQQGRLNWRTKEDVEMYVKLLQCRQSK